MCDCLDRYCCQEVTPKKVSIAQELLMRICGTCCGACPLVILQPACFCHAHTWPSTQSCFALISINSLQQKPPPTPILLLHQGLFSLVWKEVQAKEVNACPHSPGISCLPLYPHVARRTDSGGFSWGESSPGLELAEVASSRGCGLDSLSLLIQNMGKE